MPSLEEITKYIIEDMKKRHPNLYNALPKGTQSVSGGILGKSTYVRLNTGLIYCTFMT
jgi:hypothetical protein